jgi:hypothetical protein
MEDFLLRIRAGGILILSILFSSLLHSCWSDQGCEDDVEARQGINITHFENKKPKIIYELDSCRLNGVEIYFHKNGRIKSYGYGERGRLKDTFLFYDTLGFLVTKHLYVDGTLVQVTDAKEVVKYDRTNKRLHYKNNILDLSNDTLIVRSHFSRFLIYNNLPNGIFFEAEQKDLLLDKNLNIISSKIKKVVYGE